MAEEGRKIVSVTEKGLSERSEEVQEIMGPVPHWILRRGIILTAVVFAAMVAGSWFFKYPDMLQATCTVSPVRLPVGVAAPVSGEVVSLVSSDGAAVQRGDTLCLLRESTGRVRAVTATEQGRAEADINLFGGNEVARGQHLFDILSAKKAAVICLIRIPADKAGAVRQGQEARLILPEYPEEEFGCLTGRIVRIARLPGADGAFAARVALPHPVTTSAGRQIDICYPIKGTAQVKLNDTRLIEKIFTRQR